MKAGYIETRLDSESPDVSRTGRQTRAKGSRAAARGRRAASQHRRSETAERSKSCPGAPAEILAHFSHLSQFEIQKCL